MFRKCAAVGALVLLALAGCSATTVGQEEVENLVAEEYEFESGQPATVACPDDLPAEVGAEMTCTLTIDETGEQWETHLQVQSVQDEQAHFEITMSDEPIN